MGVNLLSEAPEEEDNACRAKAVSDEKSDEQDNASTVHAIRSGPGYKKRESIKPKRYGKRAGSASDCNNNVVKKTKDMLRELKPVEAPSVPKGSLTGIGSKGKQHKVKKNQNLPVDESSTLVSQDVPDSQAPSQVKRGRPRKEKPVQSPDLETPLQAVEATNLNVQKPPKSAKAHTPKESVPGTSREDEIQLSPAKHPESDSDSNSSLLGDSDGDSSRRCSEADNSRESDNSNPASPGVIHDATNQAPAAGQQLSAKESNEIALYVRHGEEFLPLQVPSDLVIDDFDNDQQGSVANLQLLKVILGIAEDVKAVLKNQENFDIRLRAMEEIGNRNNTGEVTEIKLPLDDKAEMENVEELFEKEPATRHQLIMSLSLLGGDTLANTVPLIMRSLMTKKLRLKFNAQKEQNGKFVFKKTKMFQVVKAAIRKRPGLKETSEKAILAAIGLLLTRTPEEEGGREKRRRNTAINRLALAAYKQTHPELAESSIDEH